MTNDGKLFIKVYKILINTALVYNVKILTMQAAIIKIGKIFLGKVAISVKTQVTICYMYKNNNYAVLTNPANLKIIINNYCANYQYIYM